MKYLSERDPGDESDPVVLCPNCDYYIRGVAQRHSVPHGPETKSMHAFTTLHVCSCGYGVRVVHPRVDVVLHTAIHKIVIEGTVTV